MPSVMRYLLCQSCMQKEVKTTPLQREILRALADTGDCSLPTLLNSLPAKSPALPPAALLEEVGRSLVTLYRAGCLYLMRGAGGKTLTVLVPEMAALDLCRMLRRDEAGGGWEVNEAEISDVVVRLTAGGLYWPDLIAAESSGLAPVRRPCQ